jgi:cytoskeletal protein RodZ
MKWWYILFLSLLYTQSLQSQSVVQTFVDRCTGETKIITIPFEGNTVVVFYNRSASFNINDVRSGALQAWLEETYAWWASISPCSTNQATTTATQATTQNTTQNATQNTTSTASTSTNQTSSSTSQTNNTESSSSSTGTETSDAGGGDDTGSDASSQEGDDSSGDETSSEESSEENSEGESDDDGEDSDDGEESEEEDEQSESKKSNPVIVAANVSTMSALDGSVNFVSNFGMSQASLNGVTSYSANAMIWDNLKQFNINVGRSYINKDQTVILYGGKKPKIYGGEVKTINTTSINGMYSFGTFNISFGKSKVYILPKQLIAGWASSLMVMSADDITVIPTGVGFATKPYVYDRFVISPMLAFAVNPVIYNMNNKTSFFNTNVMFVSGLSGTFNLTKNFMANLGFNIVESTANLPMTWAVTIGSRFQF